MAFGYGYGRLDISGHFEWRRLGGLPYSFGGRICFTVCYSDASYLRESETNLGGADVSSGDVSVMTEEL
jgi:hypothetical protein